MKKLLELDAGPGQKILFETIETETDRPIRRGKSDNLKRVSSDIIESMDQSLGNALNSINAFGEAILKNLEKIGPQKAEVEFSVKMTAKGNLIIASGEAEANFSVKLTWEK